MGSREHWVFLETPRLQLSSFLLPVPAHLGASKPLAPRGQGCVRESQSSPPAAAALNPTPFHLARATSCILFPRPPGLRAGSKPHKSCLFTSLQLPIPPRPPISPAIHLWSSFFFFFSLPSVFSKRNNGNGAWHCSWRTSRPGWNGALSACLPAARSQPLPGAEQQTLSASTFQELGSCEREAVREARRSPRHPRSRLL